MRVTAGIDVGSTYTKAALVREDGVLIGTGMRPTGFKLEQAASEALDVALEMAEIARADISYLATTGHGRLPRNADGARRRWSDDEGDAAGRAGSRAEL
jgi:activator of 2-hydroxyglutaryl-CoA dehydratase